MASGIRDGVLAKGVEEISSRPPKEGFEGVRKILGKMVRQISPLDLLGV